MIVSHEHRMTAQESHLASIPLLAGFEALAKLDYGKPGTVYTTLFQLATGLERTMEIASILDQTALYTVLRDQAAIRRKTWATLLHIAGRA